MNEPFLILGMPRSRTAWLANFLTWGQTTCLHSPINQFGDVAATFRWLKAGTDGASRGAADPVISLFPDQVVCHSHGVKFVYVVRNEADAIYAGLRAYQGVYANPLELLGTMRVGFDAIKRHVDGLEVAYESLDDVEVVRHLWDEVIPDTPFPMTRFCMLRNLNVTQNFAKVQTELGGNS